MGDIEYAIPVVPGVKAVGPVIGPAAAGRGLTVIVPFAVAGAQGPVAVTV